jgi:HAD superfamily hydrolase (TIGR01490 family)
MSSAPEAAEPVLTDTVEEPAFAAEADRPDNEPPRPSPWSPNAPAVLAGKAAAAKAEVEQALQVSPDPAAAAFFDIDNTLVRGAAMFHLARGLAERGFFPMHRVASFISDQIRFRVSGENLDTMSDITEVALSFVAGRGVDEIVHVGREIFDERIAGKLYGGSLAMARGHLDAGQRVWLVSAAPMELATIIAKRLGFTGALGTVSETVDGIYTGKLVGSPLHGAAKAEAIRALAEREGLDLLRCSAYSDSINDVPMLSLVGHPVAVNPDGALRKHAEALEWDVRDFRRGRRVAKVAIPVTAGVALLGGVAAGAIAYDRHHR